MQNEVDDLLQQLQQEAAKRKRRIRWIIGGVLLYVGFLVGLMLLTWWLSGKPQFGTLGSVGSMSGVIVAATAATKRQKEATKSLAQFDDLRSVGPLAEALAFNDRGVQEIAEARLIVLLPRIQATDSALLNENQRKCLYQVLAGRLAASRNIELVLAILKAYEQVGDSQAIPLVEKLAEGEGKAGQDARVRASASECLVSLRQRAEQERMSQTYLRASDATNVSPQVLLRPASGMVEELPEQLLRAGIADSSLEEPQQNQSEVSVKPASREDETKAQEILRNGSND